MPCHGAVMDTIRVAAAALGVALVGGCGDANDTVVGTRADGAPDRW